MSDTVIIVEGISKRYRLGMREQEETFAGQVKNILSAPFRNFKKIASLTKFRDDDSSVFWALKDINFEVKRGEVLGIIGHNGAGKSTLLKILSRITEPTTGNIEIKGRVSALLEVGTGFHPELSGRDNVYMNGTILGMRKKEIDQKFDEIVEFSGVDNHIDTPVKFYSSGMKVRLGFSVAAHLEPEILIIDEVLAVGDAEFQRKCLGKMEDVAGQGRTVLFVSHNMAAVQNLCNRGILLDHGKIEISSGIEHTVKTYQMTADSDNVALDLRDNRTGNRNVHFKSIILQEGQPILAGKPLRIDVHLRAQKDIERAHISILFCSLIGDRLFVIDSKSQGKEISLKAGGNDITIMLPDLRLIPGGYTIDLWCSANGEVADNVQRAVVLQVMETDFYGSGYGFNSKHGLFYPDRCEWSVNVDS